MKNKMCILPLFTVVAGILGMIFRFWLTAAGTDREGLVIPSHPSVVLMFMLAAVTVLVLALCARKTDPTPRPFGKSLPGAIGCTIAGVGIFITDILELSAPTDIFSYISFAVGLFAGVCLILLGICRYKGTSGSIWLYVVIFTYFVVHLVMQYRLWCATPQLQDYFFPLLGSVFLMLGTYARAGKDIGQPCQRQFVFFSQAALFCCFLSLDGASWPFYAAMGLWTMLDTVSIDKLEPETAG